MDNPAQTADAEKAPQQQLCLNEVVQQPPLTNTEKFFRAGEKIGLDPIATAATTVGMTGTGLVAASRYYKVPIVRPVLRNAPAAGVAAWGTAKFALMDSQDFLSSDTTNDRLKYGTACLTDLAMTSTLASKLKILPKSANKYTTAATLFGVVGRAAIGCFWEDSNEQNLKIEHPPEQKNQTLHWSTEVPLASGQKETRGYDVYLPAGYDKNKSYPVMFVLHGVTGGNGQGLMERETAMNSYADKHQFIAVFPYAKVRDLPGTLGAAKIQDWNSPGAGLTETQPGYDDVDYIAAINKDLASTRNIKVDKLYVTGLSSGGEFATHLAGRQPNVWSGVGSSHGTVRSTEAPLQPGSNTRFVSIVGDNDYMLPSDGRGRGIMTFAMTKISESEPLKQLQVHREAIQAVGPPTISTNKGVTITEYKAESGAMAKQYAVTAGWRGGAWGTILGSKEGRTMHAWAGVGKPGETGWPVIGEKRSLLNHTQVYIDDFGLAKVKE